MNNPLIEYFRCPERYAGVSSRGLSGDSGFFRLGQDALGYGQLAGSRPSANASGAMPDALAGLTAENATLLLQFDLQQAVDNLRNERYARSLFEPDGGLTPLLKRLYYRFRPLFPVGVRKYFQQLNMRGWEDRPFPKWPVDTSVENLFRALMLEMLRAQKVDRIPFIWFWPEGATGCAIMTHDVETKLGRDFCQTLMNINDNFGVKSSFQIVPESRYEVTEEFLQSIRQRGFEVNIQDLNHDGRLYWEESKFRERAGKINRYGREYGAQGFRAAVLYRRQEWFDALQFSYDMSVPNVAHLDPQHGGCCTVMPYFIGNMVELPVTATQDYMIFHLLHDYSTALWRRQTEMILAKHGMASFIVHPDYIVGPDERTVYEELLDYLTRLRAEQNVWIPLPGEVNDWWRQRAAMTLVEDNGEWRVEGQGSDRARIAYASEVDGKLQFAVECEASVGVGRAHSKRV